MKFLLAVTLAALSLTAVPSAEARDYRATYCAPTYVGTKEVFRRTECRWAVDHCGHRVSYHVIIVTFADYYSNGAQRTYTKTYRA